MQTFLAAETDPTCKRNAFVFLAYCSLPKAAEWISGSYDNIANLDQLLQMSIIEVIRKDCKNDSTHRVSDRIPFTTQYLILIVRLDTYGAYSISSMPPLTP
jgi:vesicle coat complex subunit